MWDRAIETFNGERGIPPWKLQAPKWIPSGKKATWLELLNKWV